MALQPSIGEKLRDIMSLGIKTSIQRYIAAEPERERIKETKTLKDEDKLEGITLLASGIKTSSAKMPRRALRGRRLCAGIVFR